MRLTIRGLRDRVGKDERGQGLVEFALAAIIFFFLMEGVFEFGNALRVNNELQNAAREGARYAAVNNSDSNLSADTLSNAIQPKAGGLGLTSSNLTMAYGTVGGTFTNCAGNCGTGDASNNCGTVSEPEIKVSLTYTYQTLTHLVSFGQFNATATEFNEC